MDMYIVAQAIDSTVDAVIPLGVHKMEFTQYLLPSLKMTATVASGVFAGTSFSFLFTDIPIYLALKPSVAIECFRLKLQHGTKYQGKLAILTILSTSSVYFLDRKKGLPWLLGGLLFCSSGVLTGSFFKKPVTRLLKANFDKYSDESIEENFLELRKLQVVRTMIGFAGFGVFVYELAFN